MGGKFVFMLCKPISLLVIWLKISVLLAKCLESCLYGRLLNHR